MKNFKSLSYTKKIQLRICVLWLLLIFMIVYMIFMGTFFGDSRKMSDLADIVSRTGFFGSFIYVIVRIVRNKKLLRNYYLLRLQMRKELEERNQYLHDKSGGTVMDLLLLFLLFLTVTMALINMPAFYTAFLSFLTALCLKAGFYLFYSRFH